TDSRSGATVASLGLFTSASFLAIQSFSRQPQRNAALAVDRAVVDFSAIDSAGEVFSSKQLVGQAYVLKFYRGHWCPYCRLELKAWNAMSAILSERGLRFIAISPDTPDEVRRFAEQHRDYAMRFLSDADLQVTDAFQLRSHKTLAIARGRSLARPLAIPTTIVVDERGVVRWIDQSADHQLRSDPRRVLPAIDAALGLQPNLRHTIHR